MPGAVATAIIVADKRVMAVAVSNIAIASQAAYLARGS